MPGLRRISLVAAATTIACTALPFAGGCAADVTTDLDEEAAETAVGPDGKTDLYGHEIRFGTYWNEGTVRPGEIAELTLSVTRPQELPARHYEGRYELTEQTEGGLRPSSGFFNAYRYRDRGWIRFLDETTGDYETTYERYSWLFWDESLVMNGDGETGEFFLRPPLEGTEVDCHVTRLYDDTVFEEGLSVGEYPDVRVEQRAGSGIVRVGLGAFSYDTRDGDDVSLSLSGDEGARIATVVIRRSLDAIRLTLPADSSAEGSVRVREDGEEIRVASLECTGRTQLPPAPTATCTLSRLASVPRGEGDSAATITVAGDALATSEPLAAFEGSYGFDLYVQEGRLGVGLYEVGHGSEDLRSEVCDPAEADAEGRFCELSLDVDAALGTGEPPRPVYACDFGCVVEHP